MKIKELLKVTKDFNTYAYAMNREPVNLYLNVDYYEVQIVSIAQLKKWLKETYITEMADAILNNGDYYFNETTEVKCTTNYVWDLGEHKANVTIRTC